MSRPSRDSNSDKPDPSVKVGDHVSIRKRGDTWQANWQEQGRQHRRSLQTKVKKEAISRAWKIEREIEERAQGKTQAIEPASIAEVIQAYDEYLVSEGRARKTLVKYRSVYKRVRTLADQRQLRTIDQLDVVFGDAFRAMRKRDGIAEKTRYTESCVLRQLVTFAVSRRMVATDPMVGGSLKLAKPKYEPQPCWSREEGERIVAAANEPLRTALGVLLDTGLRSGELLLLTRKDIDFNANVIHVRPKEGWKPKTGDSRAVPMTPRVRELLERHVRKLRPDDWVFCAQVSARYPQPGRRLDERKLLAALKRVTKRLGLPGHIHTFRHTFISGAAMQNVPEAVIRKWVGHIDPAILRYYTHISDTSGQREMQRLAAENGSAIRDASEAENPKK